ncbi:integrase core domain-containing protein [Deinococcus oregonensis]|uniref:Integrase core domain-containing protein n=1 Tax=Deinococcus oregonensis TaxID=1805970 RepID=A0ABV6AWN5_9DEIO
MERQQLRIHGPRLGHLAGHKINTRFIEPGKPWQNGIAERFHAYVREECLSQEVFSSHSMPPMA